MLGELVGQGEPATVVDPGRLVTTTGGARRASVRPPHADRVLERRAAFDDAPLDNRPIEAHTRRVVPRRALEVVSEVPEDRKDGWRW
jgi:hypothetical protein